jgi:hypothetical protein
VDAGRHPGAVVNPDTGELISDAEVAETEYTAFTSTKQPVTARAGGAPGPGPRQGRGAVHRLAVSVESARGAVPVLPPVRFPGPLAEPAVRISAQRALHGFCRQAGWGSFQGLGIVLPRYR